MAPKFEKLMHYEKPKNNIPVITNCQHEKCAAAIRPQARRKGPYGLIICPRCKTYYTAYQRLPENPVDMCNGTPKSSYFGVIWKRMKWHAVHHKPNTKLEGGFFTHEKDAAIDADRIMRTMYTKSPWRQRLNFPNDEDVILF